MENARLPMWLDVFMVDRSLLKQQSYLEDSDE